MMIHFLLLFLGLAVLAAGAELLVRGGSSLARHLGLTPLVVGLTVVAFGTSAPEMVVSIGASLQGHDDIAVGNIVGSNIVNIGFILGLSAIISPIAIHLGILKLDAPLVLGASLLAVWMIALGTISRFAGVLLVALLVAYTIWSVRLARRQVTEAIRDEFDRGVPDSGRSVSADVMLVLAGLGLLTLGARVLIGASTAIARGFEVSEAVIALTIVAAGTSVPELATSIVAALRKQSDIAVGNILGSNLFNILGILGLAAAAKPLRVEAVHLADLWVMTGFALVMLPLLWTGRSLQRWEGGMLVCGYIAYVALRWP